MQLGDRGLLSRGTFSSGFVSVLLLLAGAGPGCSRDLGLPSTDASERGTSSVDGGSEHDSTTGAKTTTGQPSADMGSGGDGGDRGAGGHAGGEPDASEGIGGSTSGGGSTHVGSTTGGLVGPNLTALSVAPITLQEDGPPVPITLDGTDEDDPGSELTVVVSTPPTLGELSPLDGIAPLDVSYAPHANAAGSDSFSFYVRNRDAVRSAERTVQITVSAVNDPPVAADDTAVTNWSTPIDLSVLANDSDVDNTRAELTVVSTTNPTQGSVTFTATMVRYTPAAGWEGQDSFTYNVADPDGLEATATVTIQVGASDTDVDGDGIENDVERQLGTDPSDSDSDDDGVPDGVEDADQDGELDPGETDPLEPDTDGDGFCDGLRTDGEGDKDSDDDPLDPSDPCLGPVLVNADSASSSQDGLTWATAFDTIQAGLDLAVAGRPVWVAEGRYVASEQSAPVAEMSAGARVFGGFKGGETHLQARDEASRATILDGDFLGDDAEDVALNRGDNSERVVEFVGAGLLDGFSVQNGENDSDATRGGAGASVTSPDVTLVNVEFLRNISQFSGGAVGCTSECQLTIANALFANNSAEHGGAIHAASDAGFGVLELQDTEFFENHAATFGGAVYVEASVELTDQASVFTNNSSSDDGGAIYSRGSCVLRGTRFMDNLAFNVGGALVNLGELDAESVAFHDNAAEFGGGLVNGGLALGMGSASLTSVQFLRNHASAEGAGMYSRAATVECRACEFHENEADNYGGGILHWEGNLFVEGGVFRDNQAGVTAGGARLYQADGEFRSTEFTDNTAAMRAGALELWIGNTQLYDVTFVRNQATDAQSWGGGVWCNSANCDIEGTTFERNHAYFGGGLYCQAGSCDVNNSTFESNTGDYGAGHGCFDAATECSVGTSSFVGNKAAFSGGGAYYDGALATLSRSVMQRNTAQWGGGLYIVRAELSASELAFMRNTATTRRGGALHAGLSVAGVHDSTFVENQGANGGAVLLRDEPEGGAQYTFAGATFLGNNATVDGGALLVEGVAPVLTNIALIENSAANGGGVASLLAGHPILTNASLLSNHARSAGGGLHNAVDATSTVLNSILFGNTNVSGESDVVDLGTDPSRIEYVRSVQPFTGEGNGVISQDPFQRASDWQLFLNPSLTGVASGIDAGSSALADDSDHGFAAVGSLGWSELSTTLDGALDDNSVDLGRHYSPSAVVIADLVVSATQLEATVQNAQECVWLNSANTQRSRRILSAPVAGWALVADHTFEASTEVTLICFGGFGEPAVVSGVVP